MAKLRSGSTMNGVNLIDTNDSRLSNSRNAADVYAWAKAASKPGYSWSEISSKPTTFAPIIGSGSGDAVAGNDSRLTNSRPASDVYAWAKASTKPSYTYSEVGAARAQGRVVSDFNHADFRVPGMYGMNGTPTNGPGFAYGALFVAANSDTGLQIAGGYNTNRLSFRGWASSGGTYYQWNELFHTGHLPEISEVNGLQAALDGKAPSHSHPYLSSSHDASNVTSTLRGQWSAGYTHSIAAHAPSNATAAGAAGDAHAVTAHAPSNADNTAANETSHADVVVDGDVSETAGAASKIVKRNSSGYIMNTWFNSNRGAETSAAQEYIYDTGDGYMRKKTVANVKTELVTSAAIIAGLGFTPLSTTGKAADSQTVDGIDSSRIVYGDNANKTANVSDVNTALPSGFYDGSSAVGSPTATWYTYMNMRHNNTSNNYGGQLAMSFYSNADVFVRNINNGSYGSWAQLFSTAHVPEISEVNGLQAALDAKAATHSHPYLSSSHDASNVTSTLRTQWGTGYTHSQAAHAPSNAQAHIAPTKTEIEAVLTGVNFINYGVMFDGTALEADGSTLMWDGDSIFHDGNLPTRVIDGGSSSNVAIWTGTAAEYAAIGTKNTTTLYFVT